MEWIGVLGKQQVQPKKILLKIGVFFRVDAETKILSKLLLKELTYQKFYVLMEVVFTNLQRKEVED